MRYKELNLNLPRTNFLNIKEFVNRWTSYKPKVQIYKDTLLPLSLDSLKRIQEFDEELDRLIKKKHLDGVRDGIAWTIVVQIILITIFWTISI